MEQFASRLPKAPFANGVEIASPEKGFVLLVPELTRSADIKLNGQLSLRGYAFAIASAYRRDNVAPDLHWQSRQAIMTRLAALFRTWRTTASRVNPRSFRNPRRQHGAEIDISGAERHVYARHIWGVREHD